MTAASHTAAVIEFARLTQPKYMQRKDMKARLEAISLRRQALERECLERAQEQVWEWYFPCVTYPEACIMLAEEDPGKSNWEGACSGHVIKSNC